MMAAQGPRLDLRQPATVLAMYSRYYRELSAAVTGGSDEPDGKAGYAQVSSG